MKQLARRVFKTLLRSVNRQLIYVPANVIGGIHIGEDIRLIINKQDPVCIDVGANEGQTISFLRNYFNRPRIYAIEPSKDMFSILQSNNYGEMVETYNLALGDREETRELMIFRWPVMNSLLTMDESTQNAFRDMEVIARELVDVTTLDMFCHTHNITSVDLLKVDTQGFDLHVLRGGTESLRSGIVRTVYVELNFVPMYTNQDSAKEIVNYIEQCGFKLIDFYDKARCTNGALAWCNALFTRQ